MTRVRLAMAAAVVMVTGVAGAAVASGGDRAVEVRLSEFAITAPQTLKAGRIPFVVRNDGRAEHDLVIVRTKSRPGDLPVGLGGVAPQLAGRVVFGELHSGHEHRRAAPGVHHYAPGSSKTAEIRLTPGRYVLLCSLPGHYERGQRAALVVR